MEDLIFSEIPQGFVVSSKPFSHGRKHTHIHIYSQHEFFQNLSAMDTKHQTHFYQHWKKGQCLPHSVISMTDPESFLQWLIPFCNGMPVLILQLQDQPLPRSPRCGRNHSPITIPKYYCVEINQSTLNFVWKGETRSKAHRVIFHGWTQEFRMTQMTST